MSSRLKLAPGGTISSVRSGTTCLTRGHHGHAGTDLPALEPGAQRRAYKGVRGVMAGYGASAAIFWAIGWGAPFIVVFGTLTMRLYNRK